MKVASSQDTHILNARGCDQRAKRLETNSARAFQRPHQNGHHSSSGYFSSARGPLRNDLHPLPTSHPRAPLAPDHFTSWCLLQPVVGACGGIESGAGAVAITILYATTANKQLWAARICGCAKGAAIGVLNAAPLATRASATGRSLPPKQWVGKWSESQQTGGVTQSGLLTWRSKRSDSVRGLVSYREKGRTLQLAGLTQEMPLCGAISSGSADFTLA